LDYLIKLI